MKDRRQVTPNEALDRWLGRALLFGTGAAFVLTIDLLMRV